MELDEIQGKTKEGENMKEPRIEFQNTYDRRLNEDRVSHWGLVSKRGRKERGVGAIPLIGGDFQNPSGKGLKLSACSRHSWSRIVNSSKNGYESRKFL